MDSSPMFPVAVTSPFLRRGRRAILAGSLTLFTLVTCAASALGGEIYGTIKENGKPVAKDIPVTIELNGKKYSKPTDEFGTYRIIVAETGKGTVNIPFKQQTIGCEIQSYSSSVRFDLVIENVNGQYALKRQ